jgi:hypothetical protein
VKIKEPTSEELDKLLSFLPAFEKEGRTFGHWNVSKPEDEEKHLPYAVYDKDVRDFLEIASQPCFMTRGGSNEIISKWLENLNFYETATLEQLISALSSWMRGERFTEGLWFEALKDGHIQRILRRMKELRYD